MLRITIKSCTYLLQMQNPCEVDEAVCPALSLMWSHDPSAARHPLGLTSRTCPTIGHADVFTLAITGYCADSGPGVGYCGVLAEALLQPQELAPIAVGALRPLQSLLAHSLTILAVGVCPPFDTKAHS